MKCQNLNFRALSFTIIILILYFMGSPSTLYGQIYSSKTEQESASSRIKELREGALIVPLMRHSKKIQVLKEILSDRNLDADTRSKLEKLLAEDLAQLQEFNRALTVHFRSAFDFCRVLFINDENLKDFDRSRVTFVNPETLEEDESIALEVDNYFILRYYKTSGVASAPEEVRTFKIADSMFRVLESPFPSSPDRRSIFKIRFRDLLNLSLNTNERIEILVVKLNELLYRYHNG